MKLRFTFTVDVEKYKKMYGIDMVKKVDEIKALFEPIDKKLLSVKIETLED